MKKEQQWNSSRRSEKGDVRSCAERWFRRITEEEESIVPSVLDAKRVRGFFQPEKGGVSEC
jgi:hypothetical protein